MDLLGLTRQRARDLERVAAGLGQLADELGSQLADALGALRHVAAAGDDVVEQVAGNLAVGAGEDRRGRQRLVQLADIERPAVAENASKGSRRDLDLRAGARA